MPARTGTFIGIEAKKAAPTLKHRPAIWENMLGTVYAMDDNGVVKYFDYNHEAAKQHAGIDGKQDIRLAKKKRRVNYTGSTIEPRHNQLVLWVEKTKQGASK